MLKNLKERFNGGFLNKKVLSISLFMVIVVATIIAIVVNQLNKQSSISRKVVIDSELARAMTYDQFADGDEEVDGTDNVKFSAFFLRDINGDGNAEKIKGTCKQIGKEDTLYMEINVQSEGVLKNAKIQIDGKNFYLSMSVPKDNELKDNYIGNNVKELEFNDLLNGTQKLVTGVVRSGDYSFLTSKASAIGSNIANLSRDDNKVVFSGTYVDSDGNETQISKEINLQTDWYGTTVATVSTVNKTSNITYNDLDNRKNEEDGTITLDFKVYTNEKNYELSIKKNYLECVIPQLNGYDPISVTLDTATDSFNYDESTRSFAIVRESSVDENGDITNVISRENSYNLKVVYPLNAYKSLGTTFVTLVIPVTTYYEGYNNTNSEFTNPYRSNDAKAVLTYTYSGKIGYVSSLDMSVGDYVDTPKYRYVIKKNKLLNLYNGISSVENDDNYNVEWYVSKGSAEDTDGIVMKERKNGQETISDDFIKSDSSKVSMEMITTNVGISFANADGFLNDDGYIKVYDDETDELLVTFTKDNWSNYYKDSPYKFSMPVKHIRVETSETKTSQYLYVYSQKQLDDDYIFSNYTREQFDDLKQIESHLSVYIGNSLLGNITRLANYEAPYSVASLAVSNNILSTQVTEKNEILTIKATAEGKANQIGWVDGSFLIKLPAGIVKTDINGVEVNNSNIILTSYEYFENDAGKFIKVSTENKVSSAQVFEIKVDTNITPDPRISSTAEYFELWAANGEDVDYYYGENDIYDVNDNLNTDEKVHRSMASVSFVAPNSLLTSQVASEFDKTGAEVVSPQVADVKPQVVTVSQDVPEKTVKIGAQIKNNYTGEITDVVVLGKIPFKGNTYVFSNEDLGSVFTTKMTDDGIEIPEELQGKVVVYYSENEKPDKDLNNAENGWKTAENITNWDNVKTYLIDFQDAEIASGAEYTFYYTIKIPNGLDYNEKAYSHHGVYFALKTPDGKYRTQTEPNKLGLRIADKYNLELEKYQTGKTNLVPGATYKITKEATDDEVAEVKTAVTDKNGKLKIDGLYIKRVYSIEEIKVPENYELNTDVIKIIGSIQEDGMLEVEKTQGTLRDDIEITKEENKPYTATLKVEDEAKVKLKITKLEKGADATIRGVKFKITGAGLPEAGKNLITNANGEIIVKGLKAGEEYTLEETKADGYYVSDKIKFTIKNNDETYVLDVSEGAVKDSSVVEDENIPTVNIEIENEKIPTYTLEISKIRRIISTAATEDELKAKAEQALSSTDTVYLSGAKFKLYKGTKELGKYVTDENGKITLNNLYQFVDGKDEDAVYTLKETVSPEGYSKVKDLTFKVDGSTGELNFINLDGENESYTVENNTIKLLVEDSPSFRLIKKDAETNEPLANIKFAIYDIEQGISPAKDSKGEILGTKEIINGKEYYVVTTDNQGEIVADLPEGIYKAIEVQAPEKYDISDSIYYFGIGVSREGKEGIRATDAKQFGGTDNRDIFKTIAKTSDGGYIVGGRFASSSINFGKENVLNNAGSTDGMIVKFNANREVEWARGICGTKEEYIHAVAVCNDGGYLVGGSFTSDAIDLENGVSLTNILGTNSQNGMIIKYNQKGEPEWAKEFGDYVGSVVTCSDGGYLVGGRFITDFELENGVSLSNHGYSGMVVKLNEQGEAEWAGKLGSTYSGEISSVAECADGGYIASGYFSSSTADLGNGITIDNNGSYDGVIIKYKSNGEIEYTKLIGGTERDYIYSMTATSDGGYLVGGYFQSTYIDLGNGLTIDIDDDIYESGMVIKYNSNGEAQWCKVLGKSGSNNVYSIIECADGGYLVGGYFQADEIDLGNGILLQRFAGEDGMVIKYSQDGEAQWAKSIAGSDTDEVRDVIENDTGKYIVVGCSESDNIDLGDGICLKREDANYKFAGMVIHLEEKEVYIPKVIQAQRLGEEKDDKINSVVATGDGGYVAGGVFASKSIELENGTTLSNKGELDGLVIKYEGNGKIVWAKSFGGEGEETINSVTKCDGGYIVVGSFASETIDFENGITLTKVGEKNQTDGMIIKYSDEGDVEWAKSIGGTSYDDITSIKVTKDGGFIAGGGFYSGNLYLDNGMSLTNRGSRSGILIKYNAIGDIEWTKVTDGEDYDYIDDVAQTIDGGYIAVGGFQSKNIDLGNNVSLTGTGKEISGMVIKYSSNGETEWAHKIGNASGETISTVTACSDGGCLVGGNFSSDKIDLGNGIVLNNKGNINGILIKFNENGKIEWGKALGGDFRDDISSIIECSDGGYLVSGNFMSTKAQLDNGIEIAGDAGCTRGAIIKYNDYGIAEWAKVVDTTKANGETSIDKIIKSVTETEDGIYIAGGYFGWGISQQSLDDDSKYYMLEIDGNVLLNKGKVDGMILKIVSNESAPEVQELVVENKRKEFKITTEVEEINNTKGGSISGEDEKPYEVVKYGENSTEEIKMIPNENYEIIGITVNGEEYKYTVVDDGSYIMPVFTNVTEDKHIVVRYSFKDNKVIINKVDKNTKEKLPGAIFKLDQIEERPEPNKDDIIGELTDNGQEYKTITYGADVSENLGELTNNGTYYFIKNNNGTYTPTNSKTYQKSNGGAVGIQNSTANSYIPIDLTDLTGKYAVVVNASCSSENADYGYATITENETAPSYNNSTGRFIYVSGTRSANNYTSEILEGGKIYYLHLGYRKDVSVDTNSDQIVINSIKLYSASVITNVYNFINNNGKYESTNTGKNDTVANSYIPIDLTNCIGKYNLTVNAEVSSRRFYDYGYAIVTENTTRPEYYGSPGKLIDISGTESAQDYTTVLHGGKMYYLHLGYYKSSDVSIGDDKFTVNSINVTLDQSELYHTTVETNSEGQAITQLPYGKYTVTETKAPEGYFLNETPTIIDFNGEEGSTHEFTIEDEEKAKVIVHHYIKGTTTKLADDEVYESRLGEKYSTSPKLDLDKYELEKDTDGNYILPDNATGIYSQTPIEVTYYYVEKKIPLTVHYYIEGTTTPVPTKNGTGAEDTRDSGSVGDEYTTTGVPLDELNDEYELVEVPSNAVGAYDWKEVIVTYYYRRISRTVTLMKYQEDGVTPLEGAKFTIDGNEYVTDANGKIQLDLGAGTYEITEIEAPEGYVLPDNPTTEITISRAIPATINIINAKKKGTITVHYYLEGTTTKVPLEDGSVAEDEARTGNVGDRYVTKAIENVAKGYELASEPSNGSGVFIDGNIEITYYYKALPASVLVHYYLEGTTTKVAEDVTVEGIVGDDYTTSEATVDNKYELVEIPANATGKMAGEQIVVIYYYKVKDAVVNVRYLEKGTDEELADPDRLDGKVDEEYETTAKDIDDYKMVEHTDNVKGKFEVDPITVTYYYLHKAKATVQYIDKMTGEILEESTTEGVEGDEFVTESKDFENYILVEEPEEKTIKMTREEQILKYYYAHVSGGVIEKHIDVNSGEILFNDVHEGNEGDEYDIPSKTFDGYDLVEDKLPANSKGTMTTEPIEVIYYYAYKSKVIAEYINKSTGEKMTDDVVQDGHEGDEYTTERKIFDDYKLIEEPANADGKMTKEDIKVTYYYAHISGGVIVNHVDVKTNKQLLDERKEEGYEGQLYETHEEEIDGYELVQDQYPENAKGTMTIDPIRVTYYYIKKTVVNVKYVDKDTNEEIADTIIITGHEGDEYTSDSKDISGYELVGEPENKNGTMADDSIDVIYYYRKFARVLVNYYDADTNEKLTDEIEIKGYRNDEYSTEEKEFKYYKLKAVPENKDGKMTVTVTKDEDGKETVNDTTYVNYYYRKLVFNLKVDKTVASVIVNGQTTAIDGKLGKVEIYRKDLSTANVKVVYKIKVTNDSELTGKANIVENIPSGMLMNFEDNTAWTIKNGSASLETDDIKPGESREYQVVLVWQNGDSNVGTKENVASIVTENEAGFGELVATDNVSRADLIVAVGTGDSSYVDVANRILVVMLAGLMVVLVIEVKKRVK